MEQLSPCAITTEACALQQEKPPTILAKAPRPRVAPTRRNDLLAATRESSPGNKDSVQPKINKNFKKDCVSTVEGMGCLIPGWGTKIPHAMPQLNKV